MRPPAPARAADLSLTRYVNPFIGTSPDAPDYGINNAAGDTFPGAVTPNGMAQFSPDTTTDPGGYRYNQNTINAFSLTHFSGRGVACWEDIGLMPTAGPLGVSPGVSWSAYASTFTHGNESASPGSYHVQLDKYGIGADLTVTPRTGFARFTYPVSPTATSPTSPTATSPTATSPTAPVSTTATLLLNAGHSAQGNDDAGTGVAVVGDNEVTGSAQSGNCGGSFTYKVYFAAHFDRPFASSGTWNGGTVTPGSTASAGARSGAYVTFDTRANPVVQVKVGLSFVSVANAEANLGAEDAGWDLATVQNAAAAAWNERLNSIQVQGGTDDEKTVFYTGLYHASIHPSIFSDANGQYLGFDGQVHTAMAGHVRYHNFSSWDNYRSLMPLVAVIAPDQAADMMQSLVDMARQDPGGGLPRWEQANGNSGGMLGDGQLAVIAGADAFGVTGFDTAGALAAMVHDASDAGATSGGHPVREGLGDYLGKGYVTEATGGGSAAITLEYATDDFALSRFAGALGDTATRDLFLGRAQNWKNLFNAAAGGYIVPRDASGAFVSFNPTSQTGFRESDGAQYVWMVPFNYRALFDGMGGNAAAIARLDAHFAQLNAGPGSAYAFMGNEPEEEAPWAYDFAGAPYRTQDVVRRTLLQLYHNTPGGMPGNDDGGAMGSWTVFAAIGLYPDIPGVGGFVLGSPLFNAVTIRLAGGKTLQINAPAAADAHQYVQSLNVNGAPYTSPWIPWGLVADGATLDMALSGTPNTAWGSDPTQAPPSFDINAPTTPTSTPSTTPTSAPSPSATPTSTPTKTPMPTATTTPMPTRTATPMPTATDTSTAIATNTPTTIATDTPTAIATDTPTAIATDTPIPTSTPTTPPTSTTSPTAAPTTTPTPTRTATSTSVPTATATDTPTATSAPIKTATPTPTATTTDTPIPTSTPTTPPTSTSTTTPMPTAIATPAPSATLTTISATPIASPTSTPTATPTDTPIAGSAPTTTATTAPTVTSIDVTPTARPTPTPAVPTARPTPTPAGPTWPVSSGPNNKGVSRDTNPRAADYDGTGYSYSADALKAVGFIPGSRVSVAGVTFRWPAIADRVRDNWRAAGQVIVPSSTSGAKLAFLGSATHGPSSGRAKITYTDHSIQTFTLAFGDWTLSGGTSPALASNSIAATMAYRNSRSGRRIEKTYLFSMFVTLAPGKTVASVTLPATVNRGALHVFAVAAGTYGALPRTRAGAIRQLHHPRRVR